MLQGDVGSGKTAVAALATAHAIQNGYQVALMAPTEILAEQHYLKFKTWFEHLGIEITWLTGSLKNFTSKFWSYTDTRHPLPTLKVALKKNSFGFWFLKKNVNH